MKRQVNRLRLNNRRLNRSLKQIKCNVTVYERLLNIKVIVFFPEIILKFVSHVL